MTKCFAYVAYGATSSNSPGQTLQPNGLTYPGWVRANTLESRLVTIEGGYYNGCLGYFLFADGVNTGSLSASAHTFHEDPTNPNCPADPHPDVNYDCINGACLPKTTYNTPGLYTSLADCEIACGTGCSGKCISNSEWAQIEGLSNQLKNRNCS